MRSLHVVVSISVLLVTSLDAATLERRLRRPVAVAASSDGKWLYTSNRDSGSVSIIDTNTLTVVEEITVGGRLSDLVAVPQSGLILALDEENHQLVVLKQLNGQWQAVTRSTVASFPICLLWDAANSRCFISSLWSRQVTALRLSFIEDAINVHIDGTIPLPFEPREMCLAAEDHHLIIADAFSAGLAIVDTDDWKLSAIKKIPGHNIRGLAIDDTKRLLVAQQELNPLAHSSRDDVHWGNMISNLLVSFPIEQVCDPLADVLPHRTVNQLGGPGNAAGDPGRIVLGPKGEVSVLLSGVHEVALGVDENENEFRRVAVGQRPTSAVSTSQGTMYVANMFSDSISLVDIETAKVVNRISLGPQPEMTLANRGEILFFDSRLSHDGWMSCHSCHTDGHSNGRLNDNLSDGSFAAPKRVLSLLGVAQTRPWAWNGEVKELEQQVANSIENTMQGAAHNQEQVEALVAYMKTFSAPPVLSSDITNRTASVRRGRDLFQSLDCVRCHAPPTYTSSRSYDVGLTDTAGNNLFNPPSLRGVARRRSLFHDGRATSLVKVLTLYKHQLNRELSAPELESLLDFLQSI